MVRIPRLHETSIYIQYLWWKCLSSVHRQRLAFLTVAVKYRLGTLDDFKNRIQPMHY
jgi:hypothetical protein